MAKIARVLGKEDDVEEYERHYSDIVANLEDLHWSEENKMYCDASVDEHDQSYHVCHAGTFRYSHSCGALANGFGPSGTRIGSLSGS